MPDRTKCVIFRLLVMSALATVTALIACRPTWSPDGKKLLYLAPTDKDKFAVAIWDRDTGKSEIAFMPPVDMKAMPLWLPDGKTVCVLCQDKQKQGVEPAPKLRVTLLPLLRPGDSRTIEVAMHCQDVSSLSLVPPVVVGNSLLFAGKGLEKIDLDTGNVVRCTCTPVPRLVFRVGNRACYMVLPDGQQHLEVGEIDVATLRRTPRVAVPADHGWSLGMPAPSHDLARVAFGASRGRTREKGVFAERVGGQLESVLGPKQAADVDDAGDVAILVFTDGKLESTQRLGTRDEVAIGSIEWSTDGSTLFATLRRSKADGSEPQWLLWESTAGGSVTRETPIMREGRSTGHRVYRDQLVSMALSPDGKIAAVSTALIEKPDGSQSGLCLIDLVDDKRPVRWVPVPAPR